MPLFQLIRGCISVYWQQENLRLGRPRFSVSGFQLAADSLKGLLMEIFELPEGSFVGGLLFYGLVNGLIPGPSSRPFRGRAGKTIAGRECPTISPM